MIVDLKLIQSIFLQLPNYVFVKDEKLQYRFCNFNFAKVVNLDHPDEFIGKNDHDMPWGKYTADSYMQEDEFVLQTGQSIQNKTVDMITPEGRKILSVSKSPLYDIQQRVIGILGIYIDITDLKEAEKLKLENEKHKTHLEEQSRFNKIAQQVAHDIRSPLASLSMLVKSCENLPEEERVALREVASSINDIANHLLSHYDKSEAHSAGKMSKEPLFVSTILMQIITDKRYQYQEFPVSFECLFADESYFAFILADANALKRALSNIINNGVDALEKTEGGIRLYLDANQYELKISVQDDGCGIPKEIQKKILNHVTVSAGKESGHGIGLMQVAEFLSSAQGRLEIDSKEGLGTKITLVFPRINAPPWYAQEIEVNQNDHIIIVDDDPSIHNAWRARFEVIRKKAPNLTLAHFIKGDEALSYIAGKSTEEKKRIYLLTDYEFLKQSFNGLDLITQSGVHRSVLVTSHYADLAVQQGCAGSGAKILPKLLSAEIPIRLELTVENQHSIEKQVVVIDDDPMLLKLLVHHFRSKKYQVECFASPENFLERLSEFSKEVAICFDYDFNTSEMNGFDLAKQLNEQGCRRLFMLSGMNFTQKDMPAYLTLIPKSRAAEISSIIS